MYQTLLVKYRHERGLRILAGHKVKQDGYIAYILSPNLPTLEDEDQNSLMASWYAEQVLSV